MSRKGEEEGGQQRGQQEEQKKKRENKPVQPPSKKQATRRMLNGTRLMLAQEKRKTAQTKKNASQTLEFPRKSPWTLQSLEASTSHVYQVQMSHPFSEVLSWIWSLVCVVDFGGGFLGVVFLEWRSPKSKHPKPGHLKMAFSSARCRLDGAFLSRRRLPCLDGAFPVEFP